MVDVLMVTGLVAGGVGAHVNQLTHGLTTQGHRVTVACPDTVAAAFDLPGAGAEVVDVEVGARPSPRRDTLAVRRLREAMMTVEVVHAHGLRAGALAVVARRRARTRTSPALVLTHHNAAPDRRTAALVHQGLERLAVKGADVVLAVSPDLLERAQALGARHVGLAVVPATPRPAERDRAQVRAELHVPPQTRLLVAVGRLAPQKGLDRLLEAVELLRQTHPEVLLVIAGEGPQRRALEQRIARDGLPVRLLGHRPDVPDLLAAADLVVSAARWEGQPVWLQEALAAGVPVVATDVGGTGTVLGGAGLLVPAELPSEVSGSLAEAAGRVLTDDALHARLAAASAARAADLPGVDDAVAAALTAYAHAGDTARGT